MEIKIFKKGEKFICGLCRVQFDNLEDAKTDIRQCTERMVRAGVIAAPKRVPKFRCNRCQKVYVSKELASDCAESCKAKADAEEITRGKSMPDLKTKIASLASYGANSKLLSELKKIADGGFRSSPTASSQQVKTKPESLPGEGVSFFRDGQKFQCARCKKLYPTHILAMDCFGRHGKPSATPSKPVAPVAAHK
ncbi:MAG: hypothetical protein EOP06_06040, partial [Proteobacteria bacterium]